MPNNNASRREYIQRDRNLNANRTFYMEVMRRMNPNSRNRYIKNTRRPTNGYIAFKSGLNRYVLASNGFLFKLPKNTKNTKNLSKAIIVAHYPIRVSTRRNNVN